MSATPNKPIRPERTEEERLDEVLSGDHEPVLTGEVDESFADFVEQLRERSRPAK